jgi:ubiquinone/menaquinone biosynthesis C-methylase UbiE
VAVPRVRERWQRDRIGSALYDAGVKHGRVARPCGRLMWGTDVRRLYGEIARLGSVPEGLAILDVPCGGGIAFRGLEPGRQVRYVAGDLSPFMLARARREAARLGLEGIEFVEADIERLPLADASFDLCISYNSLHCFPAPARAVAEMARVVRPGGELRGSTAVTGTGAHHDALIALYRRIGIFGACGGPADVRSWLEAAPLEEIRIERDGAIVYFAARRGSAEPTERR